MAVQFSDRFQRVNPVANYFENCWYRERRLIE